MVNVGNYIKFVTVSLEDFTAYSESYRGYDIIQLYYEPKIKKDFIQVYNPNTNCYETKETKDWIREPWLLLGLDKTAEKLYT